MALVGDIDAMFHQVRVAENERDALRFLWWTDGDVSKEAAVYRMNVHLFGGTWSPSCCNFALRRIAMDNETTYKPKTISTVLRNCYVDDFLQSVEDEEQAVQLVAELYKNFCKRVVSDRPSGSATTEW